MRSSRTRSKRTGARVGEGTRGWTARHTEERREAQTVLQSSRASSLSVHGVVASTRSGARGISSLAHTVELLHQFPLWVGLLLTLARSDPRTRNGVVVRLRPNSLSSLSRRRSLSSTSRTLAACSSVPAMASPARRVAKVVPGKVRLILLPHLCESRSSPSFVRSQTAFFLCDIVRAAPSFQSTQSTSSARAGP